MKKNRVAETQKDRQQEKKDRRLPKSQSSGSSGARETGAQARYQQIEKQNQQRKSQEAAGQTIGVKEIILDEFSNGGLTIGGESDRPRGSDQELIDYDQKNWYQEKILLPIGEAGPGTQEQTDDESGNDSHARLLGEDRPGGEKDCQKLGDQAFGVKGPGDEIAPHHRKTWLHQVVDIGIPEQDVEISIEDQKENRYREKPHPWPKE